LFYYEVVILKSPLNFLTYFYETEITIGSLVKVNIRNREVKAVVISSCDKPDFKTSEILEIYEDIYSELQIKLAKFISTYYFSSLGDALSIMMAYKKEILI